MSMQAHAPYWETQKYYDGRGNVNCIKFPGGYSQHFAYDYYNRLIHFKDSSGAEYWNIYDISGKLIMHVNQFNVSNRRVVQVLDF